MRRLFPIAMCVAAVAWVAAACGGGAGSGPGEGGRLQVLATIAPVAAIASAVAGDVADVEVLAGSGVDPHDFEPSPRDRRKLDEADLVLRIGLGLDPFADGVDSDRLVTVTDGLTLRPSGDGGGSDPHAWHDPENVKRMAEAAAERFAAADPENADDYRQNLEAYKGRLDAADAEIRALMESVPVEHRKVVTNHDSIGYFLDRYGLTFVGAVIPAQTTSAEPSAGEIAELIETIEREGVRAIFAESSVDPSVARQVAEDTGVAIVDDLYADSLGEPGSGAETIEGMLLANARKIAEALR